MTMPDTLWIGRVPGEYGGPSEYEISQEERPGFTEYRAADILTIDARQQMHEYKLDITELDPKPGTILTCKLPSGTPPEIVEQLTAFLGKHFPDNRVVVMHKDMEIDAE